MQKKSTPTNLPATILSRMYEGRRVVLPPMGERSKASLLVSITLACTLMSILLSLAWVQKSDIDYLRGTGGVMMLDDVPWLLTLPAQEPRVVSLQELGAQSVTELAGKPFTLSATLPRAVMLDFLAAAGTSSVVLSLPQFDFERLQLQSPWLPPRTLARSEAPILVFNQKMLAEPTAFTLNLTVWPRNTQERIIGSPVNMTPMFLAVQSRFEKYQDFLAGRRTGSGKQLADIGRIVLAVFAVFLFIFIDSSPECLGLGIFMSLKAIAVAISQGWLPDGMFATTTIDASRYFFLAVADVMQLYFFTQLARLWRPRPLLWLTFGVIFGIVYTLGSQIVPDAGGINWPFQVWKWRNLLVGLACLACAIPVALTCAKAKLFHRTTALLVASSGVLVQVITPLIVDIPGVTESLWYKTWYNLFEAHTPYMFALSTFINVSTLERRVKTLSTAAIRKDAIERELTLGKAVQQAFFQVPELPPGITTTYAHEAAEYVSGDILFSHWDRQNQTAVTVLCDVTGHGVQAALKASICSAMCASLWEHGQVRPDDEPMHRLDILHRRITAYLTKTSGEPEILALVGCECDLKTGSIYLYRANAMFPLLLQRHNDTWQATTRAHASNRIDIVAPNITAFVVLFSDGVVDGGKTMKHLVRYLEDCLKQHAEMDAPTLTALILAFDGFTDTRDDKTMAVLDFQKFKAAPLALHPVA